MAKSSEEELQLSFEKDVRKIRRQLASAMDEVDFIYSYGKKLLDPSTASSSVKNNMKGMQGTLENFYKIYESAYVELGRLHDEHGREAGFPTEGDKKERGKLRSNYYTALGQIESIKAEDFKSHTDPAASVTITESRANKTLPRLNLPSFDGQLINWAKFRDSYVSMVHTENIPIIDKFQYLRASLKGPALAVITSFKIEEANYNLAWQAVLDTFDNQRMLASAYLEQLLNFKPLQGRGNPEALNQFLSSVCDNVAAFKALNIREESQFLLFYLASRCLDQTTRELFEMGQKKDTFPTFDALTKFVRDRVVSLQLSTNVNPLNERPSRPFNYPPSKPQSRSLQPPSPKNFPKTSLHASKASKPKSVGSAKPINTFNPSYMCNVLCTACNKEYHNVVSCPLFIDAAPQQRQMFLKDWQGCLNCLSTKHQVQDCPSKWHCRFCPERHNSLLHSSESTMSGSKGTKSVGRQTVFESTSMLSKSNSSHLPTNLSAAIPTENHLLLGTAIARIQNIRGQFQNVRIVIDCGSQNSFITHRFLNKLGLKMSNADRMISGIGQTLFEGAKGKVLCTIRPKDDDTVELTTEAIVVSTITSHLPSITLPHSVITKCMDFNLADPYFWKPGPVDFLLGVDLFTKIWTGSVYETDQRGPDLLSSVFGFIVMGKIASTNPTTSTSLLMVDKSNDVNFQLERFWELEQPAPPPRITNPEDLQCEQHFVHTHYRLPNGRYVVHLPFRSDNPQLGDSSPMALRRFHSLEKKLKNNLIMSEKYNDFLSEYLELDHMSLAKSPPKFLIPHHCITKEVPEGLKLKVVFDASAKTSNGSLNDHLFTGPKLQNDIRNVILRFRHHRFVFSTDIIKMFRMIEIAPVDRQYMQIYWRFNQNEPVQRFELNTVIYGLVCAPFQAQRVLRQLTIDHGEDYPLAAKVLLNDSYVDDILTGASTLLEAIALRDQLIQLLKQGGFELSKWRSNLKDLLEPQPSNSTSGAAPVDLSSPEDHWVKVLGLQWDPLSDSFSFSVGEPSSNFTKRGVLSTLARLYDPLGFLTPITFLMKTFIQELWINKYDWDQELTQSLMDSWMEITKQLPQLSELRIPRCIVASVDATSFQLVGFCDASTKGYASVIYLKVNTHLGYKVSLLTSKSKLAPTNPQSVPRLELSGALLLAELYAAVSLHIQIQDLIMDPPVFFTDSTIVLAWINTPAHKLKVFAANRVVKIQELTAPSSWRHVVSLENPSDVASRGIFPSQILNHDLWWSGPSWMSLPLDQWPSSNPDLPEVVPEMKVLETNALASVNTPSHLILWMSRFSSFITLVKATAWLRRWLHNLKHLKCCCCALRSGCLKKMEFEEGLLMCIKVTQAHYFHDPSQTKEKYRALAPSLDAEGVWRVGGRLRHSSLPESEKHPILLPHNAHLTALLVDYYHRIYLHPGPTTLQAVIQKRYWVPSLRRLIRLRGFRCKPCYQSRATSVTPFMGDLPSYRVKGGRTFQHVGIDFAGPFPLKESNRRNAAVGKVYLCLYVCMATKALHLEAVTRLTTEAFLASFQRFTSRRGIPTDVYTDNGSNFLGAAAYLKELYQWFAAQKTKQELLDYAMDTCITWHFNPPQTPHMGGVWEAGVKSVKRYLRLIAAGAHLTFEEITTWFARIEAILNSRPLCPLSTDPDENGYLSPGHFLVGGPLVVAPEPSLIDVKENLLSRWQLVSRMSEQFWQRWSKEYLQTLQRRPKWVQMKQNLEIGDLVLLKENLPPLQWKLARVIAVHPGEDDVVRVVTVQYGNSNFRRHVANLVPLPHHNTPSFPDSP